MVRVSTEAHDEMGPIDYVVIEWAGKEPSGEAAPLLVDLVDRGIIRVLDLVFVRKDEDGKVARLDFAEAVEKAPELEVLDGASSGLLADDDIDDVGEVLEPGATAALLVYENSWAGPFAAGVRRGGGQLVANGRIPVQAMLAALDAVEKA